MNNKNLALKAPLSGPVMPLNRVPDPVFSSGTLGEGIAIDPLNDCLHAPCAGLVSHLARTRHALSLRADNGAELLLHVGLDTVQLQGEGFEALVEEGARVIEGQPLLRFDLDRVARGSRSLITVMILTNGDGFQVRPLTTNPVEVGAPLLQLSPEKAEQRPANPAPGEGSAQRQVRGRARVAHHGGLHARPAALLRKTAQGFSSQAELHFAGQVASVDSLVGIMGLGVAEQDEVEVICRGEDSEAALDALLAALASATAGAPKRIEIGANVASPREAAEAFANGADGVGLLRTEFLFLERRAAPDEEEQRNAYQEVLDAMGQRKVIIRTIDVGGDKHLDYLPLPVEENPALGVRGIRLGQARPELLDQQLRALLRVEPLERCRILLPMVSEVDELRAIRGRLGELATQLGIERLPELGVMIEVPSAALLADQLAEHADFLSIGTNDLSQYALAMDRCHAGLADRIDALHPALLRLIAQTCAGAARHGRWVGVCGALASDPLATPVLVGLGVEELSVGPNLVGEIKTRVRQLDAAECRRHAQALLDLGSARAVRDACLQHWPLA
ncbi:phosphoenolpyruvate-protein phosphotransferase [Pseudomonas aeruginosa VRFPA02]|nr:phosphoenolpyruvate-protein phosphotransferase [Pseudomonas aeruginosa VRFPA02]